MEQVILVDEHDCQTGIMEKLQAHLEGRLHRAISVFICNSKGDLLLQQRAPGKYHSPGLWTNTCCSHPRPAENVKDAAERRLYEEMGLKCELKEMFSFVYEAPLQNNITEHEYDHVFTGITDDIPLPDGSEVAGWKYVNIDKLVASIKVNPGDYTEWFKIIMRDYGKDLFNPATVV